MRGLAWALVAAVLVACDGPDEWTCEVTFGGATVCLDENGKNPCRSEWGGTAEPVESEPGGPYFYCQDIGYPVECPGSVVQEGEGFTAELTYYAASEEDCAAVDGSKLGG